MHDAYQGLSEQPIKALSIGCYALQHVNTRHSELLSSYGTQAVEQQAVPGMLYETGQFIT
jgi:hypothetical protein